VSESSKRETDNVTDRQQDRDQDQPNDRDGQPGQDIPHPNPLECIFHSISCGFARVGSNPAHDDDFFPPGLDPPSTVCPFSSTKSITGSSLLLWHSIASSLVIGSLPLGSFLRSRPTLLACGGVGAVGPKDTAMRSVEVSDPGCRRARVGCRSADTW
jgi:hypothetical protein